MFGIGERLLVIAARNDDMELTTYVANRTRKYLIGACGETGESRHPAINIAENRFDAVKRGSDLQQRSHLVGQTVT